jgi:hypothetical protein
MMTTGAVYVRIGNYYGSTALLLGLIRFFSFLIIYTVGRTPWPGDKPVARPLPTHRTTQNKRTQYRHPCLEWVSNPRSQCKIWNKTARRSHNAIQLSLLWGERVVRICPPPPGNNHSSVLKVQADAVTSLILGVIHDLTT